MTNYKITIETQVISDTYHDLTPLNESKVLYLVNETEANEICKHLKNQQANYVLEVLDDSL